MKLVLRGLPGQNDAFHDSILAKHAVVRHSRHCSSTASEPLVAGAPHRPYAVEIQLTRTGQWLARTCAVAGAALDDTKAGQRARIDLLPRFWRLTPTRRADLVVRNFADSLNSEILD